MSNYAGFEKTYGVGKTLVLAAPAGDFECARCHRQLSATTKKYARDKNGERIFTCRQKACQ